MLTGHLLYRLSYTSIFGEPKVIDFHSSLAEHPRFVRWLATLIMPDPCQIIPTIPPTLAIWSRIAIVRTSDVAYMLWISINILIV